MKLESSGRLLPAIAFAALCGWGWTPHLLAQSNVAAWGDNYYNQTAVPSDLTNAVAVSAGMTHSLALRANGRVASWGDYPFLQFFVPADLTNAVAVAAGGHHSLALRGDGTVAAWGDSDYDFGQTNVPAGLTNVVTIAAGGLHSLALKADGSVAAWGYDGYGQTNVPAGLANVIAIAGGGGHSLALKADGTVVAWGANGCGQNDVPTGLTNIVAIAGGGSHSMALKADGTIVSWGCNPSAPTNLLAALTNVVAIGAGWLHSLALKADGTVVAWGDNGFGQTNGPVGLSNVVAIAAGFTHSLALTGAGAPFITSAPVGRTAALESTTRLSVAATGALPLSYQWRFNGTNIAGATNTFLELANLQPGHAGAYSVVVTNALGVATSSSARLTLVPLLIITQPESQHLLVGATVNFSVLAAGATPLSWQWRFNGADLPAATNSTLALSNVTMSQAGAYSVLVSNVHTAVQSLAAVLTLDQIAAWGYTGGFGQTNLPSGLTNVVAIAGGGYHALALRADGTVAAWGNSFSQTNVPSGLTNVAAIAGGGSHSLALKPDGTVAAWGDGTYGQTNVPMDLTSVAAVAAGASHSLALTRDGTVVAWGRNNYGQTNVPAGLTNVVAIAAGASHSLALKPDGRIIAWGDNQYGQTNVPSGLTNAVATASGADHSLALRADGTVAAWGISTYGPANVPEGLTNVVAIAGGYFGSMALKADGTLVAWGDNTYGQTNVPAGLTNVVAIAGSGWANLALIGSGPPFIVAPPVDRTAAVGMTIQLLAPATGTRPLSYQWQFNGTNIAGATGAMLVLSNLQPGQTGYYSVVVSNELGMVTSSNSRLRLVPLMIAVSPQSQRTLIGTTVSLSVVAHGAPPLDYQWRLNGADLPEATNSTLTLDNVQLSQAGDYSVAVSNAYTVLQSSTASLSLDQIAAWGYNGVGQTNVPAGLTNVVTVAAGGSHNLALKADGSVVAWGNNSDGQTNVPGGLMDVMAVAAGNYHSLALKGDGTVAAWGRGSQSGYSLTNVPAGLTNVVAISAGGYHSLALKADGTAVAWGFDTFGETNVPAGLTNVVAVAAGTYHSAALKADGTVVVWGSSSYGLTNVPAGVTNVAAIAAGFYDLLALKADGTVVAWGYNDSGQTNVPADLTKALSIAAGGSHSMALQTDGRVVAWGNNGSGRTSVPACLTDVAAIAAGGSHSLALAGSGRPHLAGLLSNRSSTAGASVYFCATAVGSTPLSYQWQFNGADIAGATDSVLALANTQPWQAGAYRIVVSNSFGSVTSSVAVLTVTGLPAEGPLYVTNIVLLAGGSLQFQAVSAPGAIVDIQASTNLASWAAIGTITNTTGLATFVDSSTNFTRRFYRLKLADASASAAPALSINWSNNLPQISITGSVGSRYALDSVATLAAGFTWQGLTTNLLTSNPLVYTDTSATGVSQRFYRARLVP